MVPGSTLFFTFPLPFSPSLLHPFSRVSGSPSLAADHRLSPRRALRGSQPPRTADRSRAGPRSRGRGALRGGAGALEPPRQTAAMEQAPRDPERQLQPAPLEPLGHPDAGLQAAVGEEAEGPQDEGSGEGTVRRRGGRGHGAWCRGLAGRAGLGWRGPVGSAGKARR